MADEVFLNLAAMICTCLTHREGMESIEQYSLKTSSSIIDLSFGCSSMLSYTGAVISRLFSIFSIIFML